MSASAAAPSRTLAPAAANSASGMPDFVPALGSTATSAPSPCIFLTVSGVAATRASAGSTSRATAMRIALSPGDRATSRARASALDRACAAGTGRAAAARAEREREQRKHYHYHAGHSLFGQEAVDGHEGRNHEYGEGNEPLPRDGADRQAQDDVGEVGAAHEDQMNETVVHRLVRRQVAALRGGIFDGPVVGHSRLQCMLRRAGLTAIAARGQ